MDRQRFFIDKKSFWGRAAVACFVVAVVFRMIGSYWHIGDCRIARLRNRSLTKNEAYIS